MLRIFEIVNRQSENYLLAENQGKHWENNHFENSFLKCLKTYLHNAETMV